MDFNHLFDAGKITILMDGTFGSSGKAKMASYIAENSDTWTFACNTFAPQAGHTVVLDDGKRYFYQTLNSCAYLPNKYEKIYIGPGGMIELPAFFRELEENNIPRHKIGISPSAAILQSKDAAYERGEVDLDGTPKTSFGTLLKGSTAHGVGAATVRKILRRSDAVYAKNVPELKEFICDVPGEIIKRLEHGESGFGEIAQGFPLSLNHSGFCGYTTSRNVTVSQFMSDMFLPPIYAGQTIINFRTFPIRINSDKFVDPMGKFLTWDQVKAGELHTVIKGNSGPWYPDQVELDWDTITMMSGSNDKLFEITSVTKLPRRVATFSQKCLEEALVYNNTGHKMWVTVNFMNYVDADIYGMRGSNKTEGKLHGKCMDWLNSNIIRHKTRLGIDFDLLLIGTGPATNDVMWL